MDAAMDSDAEVEDESGSESGEDPIEIPSSSEDASGSESEEEPQENVFMESDSESDEDSNEENGIPQRELDEGEKRKEKTVKSCIRLKLVGCMEKVIEGCITGLGSIDEGNLNGYMSSKDIMECFSPEKGYIAKSRVIPMIFKTLGMDATHPNEGQEKHRVEMVYNEMMRTMKACIVVFLKATENQATKKKTMVLECIKEGVKSAILDNRYPIHAVEEFIEMGWK